MQIISHSKLKKMADVFSQIDLHIVFAVKYRQALINASWKEKLYQYITGIIQNHKHKLLSIGGVEDHIHIFIGYNPSHLLPDLVREIKVSSNEFIKLNRLCPSKFAWQNGYGVFSHNRKQRNIVINYIQNQEEHHRQETFKREYVKLLKRAEIAYKEEYLFDFFDKNKDSY